MVDPVHPSPKIAVHYEARVGSGGSALAYGGPKKTLNGARAAARWLIAPDGGGFRWACVVEVHTISVDHFVEDMKRG